ncbi:MAG: hypothetical protein OXJ55_13615 [Caldilineaceae bacterium]|nr:hypothetical protein [Caldilineaceae bacterium]
MSSEATLFAHITQWLTNRIEDVAVEALGYILSQSPAARRALTDVLKEGGMDVKLIDRIETQEIGDEGEIPDLSGYDAEDTKRVLIEAKFWAELTKNQPNQYLQQLQEERGSRPAALLVLAPRARLRLLWLELRRRVKEEAEFVLPVTSEMGDLRSASTEDGELRLLMTSWASLLGRMERQADAAGETGAKADIKQLRGLTNRMDGDAYLPLQKEDLKSEPAKYMLDAAQLVDDATDHAKRNGWANTEGLKATPQGRGYGRFVDIGGVETWFGIHLKGWAHHVDTPLWLSYHRNYHVHLRRAEVTKDCFEIEGRFCIPIQMPDAEEYHEVLNSVVNALGRFAKRFDSSVPNASERVDSHFFRPWHPEEPGQDFARRILGVARLVDEAARCAVSRAEEDGIRWANSDGLRKIINPRRDGYGRFIRIGGVKAWFGIHYGAWARHRNTPLWLTFDFHERPRLVKVAARTHEVDWKHCIPIDLPATAELDEALGPVVDRLQEIAESIQATRPKHPV